MTRSSVNAHKLHMQYVLEIFILFMQGFWCRYQLESLHTVCYND